MPEIPIPITFPFEHSVTAYVQKSPSQGRIQDISIVMSGNICTCARRMCKYLEPSHDRSQWSGRHYIMAASVGVGR